MNEEVINDLYNNAVSKGYKKSIEEFVSLLQSNDAVMNDMYAYVQSKGYKKGVDDFKGLIGATVESPMAIQSVAEEPKKKEDTVSPSVDGGLELTKFDPRTSQVVQEAPVFAKEKDFSGLAVQVQDESILTKQPRQERPLVSGESTKVVRPKDAEFGYQAQKAIETPLPQFVEEQLSTVTPSLIGKTEENVVPQLKYQFAPLGFNFKESSAGDYMIATSPSGESIEISLDITDAEDRKAEADKLNAFLRKGAGAVNNLSTLQSQYTEANKKILSQKELDDSLTSINAEETNIMARNAEFVKTQSNLEAEKARLESVPPQQRNNPEYIARVNDFISRADQFSSDFQTFIKDAEDLSKRGDQLNKSIGKYTEMKAQQGTWYGAGLNAVFNKSIYDIAKGMAGLAVDFMGEVIPATGLPIMSQEDYEKNFIEQARKEGIDVPEGEDFVSLTSRLDAETIANIENRVIDVGKKIVKGEVIGSLDKASNMAMESSGVSPEYYRSIEETFVGGALLGAGKSILPALTGNPILRTVLMSSQVLAGLDAEMANDPAFADVSENEKLLVKAPIAVAVGVLENLGLSNLLKQKGFLNGLVLKALGKVGTGASYKTFGEVIKNEIDSAVGRGALTLGAGFLAEAETGALQEITDIGAKELYNMVKEKEMFDTPDSVVQFIEQVGKATLQEGIGAGVLAVPGSVSAAYTGKGFLGMDDAQFSMFEKMANDSNIQKAFVTRLKSRINTGEITASKGKEILDNYNNSVSLFNSLPDNLDMRGKKEAMNLLKEKRDLERQIDGKDQALTAPQRNRVTQINEQLTKLSEDAIQKQAAGEVPVQPGTGVSQEVAQGEPQAEPQGVTQEGQVQEEVAPTQELDLDGEISMLEQLLAQEETAPTKAAGISISSEADVNDLRNRTQSRSQQATTKEEKESANTRIKIIDTAKKAINTLKSVFPDVDIVIHDDEGSYNAAMADIDGVAGSRGNFFIDTTPDGKTTGRIDINLSKANSRTVAHEIGHGILLKTFGDNKNLFNDFRTRMSNVLKSDVNQQLNDFANQYVDPTTGELLDVNHEEFLAELTGILEQQEANVSVTTMQKVAALINEFVSKITGGKFKPFENTKNTKDVVDFFNTISGAIREGQGLEGVTEKINPNAEPTGTNVDTSSLKKRSSLIEKLGLERFSDMNQRITEGITLNSLGDIISHLTFSDRLVTGRVGNKDYLGGILFAAATNRVWASFTKGRVSQIISGMPKNEDGYRYLMPALLTEGAHMSNKDMSNTAIKLVEDAISNGDISPVDADSRIRKALNRKGLESFSKLYSDTIGKNKLTPELVISAIDNAIVKSNSTFEDRNTFLESLLGKADIDLKKRFGTLPSYNVLANGLAEPITNRHEFGDILLVIRTKGDLVAVQPKEGDPDYHPSYPWVIRSVNADGSIADVETLIFDQSYNAVNVFPEVTNKQGQKFTYQQYVDKYGDGAKSRYLGYMGARSAMSTSVTEKIATEAQPKSKVISRSQINDALSKASGTTQVATTTGSYVKAANILKNSGVDGDVLDYGAGLGLGSDAMSDVLGQPVDSLEVNPERWKGKTPVKYTDANQIDKKYDGIVSLNVVNVVPKSIRDFIIKDIFNNLKDGGTAIISSRGFKGDIDQAKNFVPGPEEKSYIIKRKQDGEIIDVFQKGYDGNELVEYVQDLLGDSAEVVSNNTFGNKGVIIKKSSEVKRRSQLPGNDAQRVVNLGRANGLSEQAISTVLQKRGFTQEAIDAALGKAEPAAKKVEVTEEFAPGYNRVLNEIFGIVAKSRERNRPEEGTMQNAINYLGKTRVYINATDVQREAMVRNLRKEFKKREKAAPSAEKVIGKPKKKEVTVDEMAALKDQIKLEARAAREAKGDLNTKRKALAAAINKLADDGKITAKKAETIAKRALTINLDSEVAVNKFIDYVSKVFADADYTSKLANGNAIRTKIKKASRNKEKSANLRDLGVKFSEINPSMVEDIDQYNEIADKILKSIEGSSLRSGVKFAEIVKIADVSDYINTTIEKQRKEILNGKIDEMSELLGIEITEEEYFKIIESINNNEPLPKKYKDGAIRKAIDRAFNVYSAIIDDIFKTGKDPVTGEEVSISDKKKKVVKNFMSMDLNLLSDKEALAAIDSLLNFIQNGSTAKMSAIYNRNLGEQNSVKLEKKGFKSFKLKKYFSPGLAKVLVEQFTQLDLVVERMFKGFTKAGDFMFEAGISALKKGKSLAQSLNNKIVDNYFNTFYKSKPNGQAFNTIFNTVERGMTAYMMRTTPGTEAEINAEFKKKKGLIEQSIANLKKGDDKQKDLSDVYTEVYDKLVKGSENYDDVVGKADPKNVEAVRFWQNEWANKYEDLSDLSENIYNKTLGSDLNYTPIRVSNTGDGPKIDESSDEMNRYAMSFHTNNQTTYQRETGVLMTPTLDDKLSKGAFIDLSFDTNNANSMYDALIDLNTADAVRQIAGFFNSDSFENIIQNADDRGILKGRVNLFIRNIRNKTPYDNDQMAKAMRTGLQNLAALGAGRALAGPTQALKQTLPVIMNTISNAGRIDLTTGFNKDKNDFINNSGYAIANRSAASTNQIESINKLADKAAKSLPSKIIDPLLQLNELQLKWFLQKPDAYVARASWMSYYEKSLRQQGIDTKSINYSTHELNDKAADYAQRMVDRQQNLSDMDLAGKFVGSKFWLAQFINKTVMPFSSFRINQSARLGSDWAALTSKVTTDEDRWIAARSIGGFFVEMATFRAVSATISVVLASIASLISGREDDEEDRDKLFDMIIKGSTTSAIIDIVSFLPYMDDIFQSGIATSLDVVQDMLEVEDADKFPFYEPKDKSWVEGLGMLGITYQRGSDLIDLIDVAYTRDYKDDFGRTKYITEADADILKNFVLLNILSSVGITSPEIKTMTRRTLANVKRRSSTNVSGVKQERGSGSRGGGGGGGRAKTMNKSDLKRYFPEQYNQLYGEGSATYEIEQEIKAFEKEQREFKKSIKDQVYGGKD